VEGRPSGFLLQDKIAPFPDGEIVPIIQVVVALHPNVEETNGISNANRMMRELRYI